MKWIHGSENITTTGSVVINSSCSAHNKKTRKGQGKKRLTQRGYKGQREQVTRATEKVVEKIKKKNTD